MAQGDIIDVRVFDGTKWESLIGPQGETGPQDYSVDCGNLITLGSDGLVYLGNVPVRVQTQDDPPVDNSTYSGTACGDENAVFYTRPYQVVWGKSYSPPSAPYLHTEHFVLGQRRHDFSPSSKFYDSQLDLLGDPSNNTAAILFNADGKGVVAGAAIEFGPSRLLSFRLNVNEGDPTQPPPHMTLDPAGNLKVPGATVGDLSAGQSSSVEAAEDFVVGYRGMLCHGVANLDGRLAVLNVTNQAGQFNLASKDFNTGNTTCSYRIQAQATGTFRIFDVTANANRMSWAANGDMTVPGNTAFQGAANTFRQASINSEALGPMQFVPVSDGARPLAATDIGKVILLSGANRVDINLSTNAAIPVGSVVEILNTATGTAGITSDSSTFLFYNVRNTYFGGANADVEFSGRYTTVRLIKTASNTWIAIGDLANPNK
jgi:hypothetical protein